MAYNATIKNEVDLCVDKETSPRYISKWKTQGTDQYL